MAEIHSVYLMQRNTAVASYKWISTELISKFKEEK